MPGFIWLCRSRRVKYLLKALFSCGAADTSKFSWTNRSWKIKPNKNYYWLQLMFKLQFSDEFRSWAVATENVLKLPQSELRRRSQVRSSVRSLKEFYIPHIYVSKLSFEWAFTRIRSAKAPDSQSQAHQSSPRLLKTSELIRFSLSYIKPLQGEIISRLTKDIVLSKAWIYGASARSRHQIRILLWSQEGSFTLLVEDDETKKSCKKWLGWYSPRNFVHFYKPAQV